MQLSRMDPAYRSAVSQRRRLWSEQTVSRLLRTSGSDPPRWPFAAGCTQDSQRGYLDHFKSIFCSLKKGYCEL